MVCSGREVRRYLWHLRTHSRGVRHNKKMAVFVYGSYSTEIDSSRPKGAICPDCNSKNQIGLHKVIDVIHFMYVPIIPTKIETIIHCKSCGLEFSKGDLDKKSKNYWSQFDSLKRTPIWFFSGPLTILLVLGYLGFSKFKSENKMLERLQNGNQNQIIEYEKENGSFSTMKTIKITNDSIWFHYNDYQIDDHNFIDRITGQNLYSTDTTTVGMETIKTLINNGKVQMIYRY